MSATTTTLVPAQPADWIRIMGEGNSAWNYAATLAARWGTAWVRTPFGAAVRLP